jgi:hypothetical protein
LKGLISGDECGDETFFVREEEPSLEEAISDLKDSLSS